MTQVLQSASTLDAIRDRIEGALMGAFVGDALALGPHWYYDLDAQRRDYGPWVQDYTAPKAGRYHEGLSAGDSSQAGFIHALVLESILENHGYDQADFCRRLDEELLAQIDGTPYSGPGGYTSQSVREAWAARKAGRAWGAVAGFADNTESCERTIGLAVRYAFRPAKLVKVVSQNTVLLQRDVTVVALTTAFALVLGQLIAGYQLDADLPSYLMQEVREGRLPFHGPPIELEPGVDLAGHFPSPEPLIMVSTAVRLAQESFVTIEPASSVAKIYGLPCAIYNVLPSVYYLAARFQGDFGSAVLHAVNGGGQNLSRAMLTGALTGAIGGLQAIPKRFIEGLKQGPRYAALARKFAELTDLNGALTDTDILKVNTGNQY